MIAFFALLGSLAGPAPAQAALPPDLAKLVGTYVSEGHRFVVTPAGNTLALRTDAELTKESGCHTRVGPATGQYYDPRFPGAAEVYYQLDRENCPGVDGAVTLHYNRAFTGVDVFLIDVMIQRNSVPMNPHGITNGRSVRWSLTKVSGS